MPLLAKFASTIENKESRSFDLMSAVLAELSINFCVEAREVVSTLTTSFNISMSRRKDSAR